MSFELQLIQVGATVLSRTLSRLPKVAEGQQIVHGLGARDDAAVMRPPPPGYVLIQTLDFFRTFISDPYIFGAIAANNALGVNTQHESHPASEQVGTRLCMHARVCVQDCFAMGGKPTSALAVAVVPFGTEAKMEQTLFQMMAGAVEVLNDADCSLVGGHTCEGAETSLGIFEKTMPSIQATQHQGF